MKNNIFALCVFAGLSIVNSQAYASFIDLVNAGFEDPFLEDGSGTFPIPGWNVRNIDPNDTGFGSHIENPGFASFYSSGIEGRNVLTANRGEIVSQSTNVILAANTQYQLQVNVGRRGFNLDPWNGYLVQLWAGDTLLSEDNSSLLPQERSFLTSSIMYDTLTNDTLIGGRLNIRLQSFSGVDVVFDDVKLNFSTVPAPASIWLLLSGLAGLGLTRRKLYNCNCRA